eukprot:scpid89414/ scgid13524/ 
MTSENIVYNAGKNSESCKNVLMMLFPDLSYDTGCRRDIVTLAFPLENSEYVIHRFIHHPFANLGQYTTTLWANVPFPMRLVYHQQRPQLRFPARVQHCLDSISEDVLALGELQAPCCFGHGK